MLTGIYKSGDTMKPINKRVQIMGIDPGLTATGVGFFAYGRIYSHTIRPAGGTLTERIHTICNRLKDYDVGLLVIELPQVYQGGKAKGDPNDLIKLAALVGALSYTIKSVRTILVSPGQWKGQLPKDVHHKRIKKRMQDYVCYGGLSKDSLDALGLCFWGVDNA